MDKPPTDFAQQKSQVEALLERGEWRRWRDRETADSALRAATSRAWCANSYWNHHNPPLEDWKAAVEDMAKEGLEERHLNEMASAVRALPFPPIPLFESEQVDDLCGLVRDAEALAALAEALEHSEALLTLESETAARRCWERASQTARQGLAFSAWRWMWTGGEPKEWPRPEEAISLRQGSGVRRSAALMHLKQAVQANLGRPEEREQALALADALAFWKNPAFTDRALRELAATADPTLRRHLETALAAESVPLFEDAELSERLSFIGSSTLAGHVRPGGRSRQLILALLAPQPDPGAWADVEREVSERTADSLRPHPLTAMAAELRNLEVSIGVRNRAWIALYGIFTQRPALLAPDPVNASAILPAFELAAALRSHITAGIVATGLINTAGPHRRDPRWWKALLRSLRPMPRESQFGNAGDRSREALEAVQNVWGLRPEEKQALEAAISDGVHGRR